MVCRDSDTEQQRLKFWANNRCRCRFALLPLPLPLPHPPLPTLPRLSPSLPLPTSASHSLPPPAAAAAAAAGRLRGWFSDFSLQHTRSLFCELIFGLKIIVTRSSLEGGGSEWRRQQAIHVCARKRRSPQVFAHILRVCYFCGIIINNGTSA